MSTSPPRDLRGGLGRRLRFAWHRLRGRSPVHVLHIGKTGGTAIKHALADHLVTDQYIVRLHTHRVRLWDIPVGERVVFFLRDPVERFVSGFLSRQRQGMPRYHTPWSGAEQRAFERFDAPNSLAEALNAGDLERRAFAEEAMRSIQHVNAPYANWFGTESAFESRLSDIWFVGFQSCLSEDFKTLCEKLGIIGACLPEDEIEAHRSPVGSDMKMSAAAIDNLQVWYEADIKFFERCKQLRTDLSI